ncbi:MAG: flavin reductase family protein [Theionarchaea archaeon]|nr:flavin reductase family protein [Theionarchaea archaeon]
MRESEIKEAISRKYPESVVLVVSVDGRGRPNAMPAGWCMFTSGDPPMIAVSIHPDRYTHELISRTSEFVITFPGEGQANIVELCGSCTGSEVDKFDCFSIPTSPASMVRPPLIEGSVACLECEVESMCSTGDHTIFVGRIVAGHVSEEPAKRLYNLGGDGVERFKPLSPPEND